MKDKEYIEYQKKKINDAIIFGKEWNLKKEMAEKAIKERSNMVIQDIIQKNSVEIAKDEIKYQEENDLIKQIGIASTDGNFELVQELINKL